MSRISFFLWPSVRANAALHNGEQTGDHIPEVSLNRLAISVPITGSKGTTTHKKKKKSSAKSAAHARQYTPSKLGPTGQVELVSEIFNNYYFEYGEL